ncbi:hypothetical protein ACEPAG_4900 [Sanghuangporus baumii]
MQSAPKGLGHLASGVRSLHVHAHAPRPVFGAGSGAGAGAHHPPRPPTSTVTGRIIQTTKTAFTRFLSHLTAPGFTHPVAWGQTARGLSSRVNTSVRPQTIQQGLSLPARHALSRPKVGPPFMPYATPATRSTVNVGLGTARNFSTARPLFQQFAQNVPVAGRAIYEADWNLEKRKMKDKKRMELKTTADEKENARPASPLRARPNEPAKKAKELERYFPVTDSADTEVSTVLLVPLAPTPTSRLPLTETYGAEPTLLVVSDLEDILSSHRLHSLRVSSLFARLDAFGAWEKGAKFTALGDANGLCTVLRIEFNGWTESMVKNVLGDAGRGWCRMIEIKHDEGKNLSEGERTSTPISTVDEHDPATSVILPTLDFSASFHATCESLASHSSPPPSPPLSGASSPMPSVSELSFSPSSDFEMDIHSDAEFDANFDMHSDFSSGSGSIISFSSDFLQRSAIAATNEDNSHGVLI